MINITGDTHGEYGRFANKRMRKNGMELTSEEEMQERIRNIEIGSKIKI